MARFQVGDEVYIKGVVREIESDDGTYPVKVNLIDNYRADDFTLGGLAKITHTERSLFHASEIQSPRRGYKIGQKLNGFAEVMQALIDGEFIRIDGTTYSKRETLPMYWNGKGWSDTTICLGNFLDGTIVEDPTPKKMVAYKNNITGAFYITEKEISDGYYVKSTKQELAAILERVE